jgi:hypothetical protein
MKYKEKLFCVPNVFKKYIKKRKRDSNLLSMIGKIGFRLETYAEVDKRLDYYKSHRKKISLHFFSRGGAKGKNFYEYFCQHFKGKIMYFYKVSLFKMPKIFSALLKKTG